MEYLAMSHINHNFYVINSEKDTVFRNSGLNERFDFIDVDVDGNDDIVFEGKYYNIPNSHDVLLFDSKGKTFKLIENFSMYPDALKISNTRYFSSYHRSGCAGGSWDSDLFYIENFKLYSIGNISYDCNDDFIIVNKIIGSKLTYYTKLKLNFNEENKRRFIDHYWRSNYSKFE